VQQVLRPGFPSEAHGVLLDEDVAQPLGPFLTESLQLAALPPGRRLRLLAHQVVRGGPVLAALRFPGLHLFGFSG
jgi:hypothetical protein